MDDLLADFLMEVSEGLGELDDALVTLERAPDDAATLSLIFRQVHTIKGTCGFLGLSRLERVAHAAEDVLGRLRDRELHATPPVVDRILAAIDCIRSIVTRIGESGGSEPPGDDSALIADLRAVAAAGARPVPAAGGIPAAAAGIDPPAGSAAVAGGEARDAAEPPPAVRHTRPQEARAADRRPADAMRAQTIRVGVETLESLMTLVGELVLTRNQLMQISRSQTDTALAMPLQRLSRLTSELQDSVMKTRMQPIGSAWNKLPRLVRDLGAELGKGIALEMLGAETELDRQVLEQIRDPLTHVVRNAADHGLETAAGRQAAGKPEIGRIGLRAFHEGGHVVIEISDDGKGLDTNRIRAKALDLGLATETELAGMAEAQVHRFIFMAGFSTAPGITSVSGRGVGMDVVRTNIERINGAVDIRSEAGRGTTLSIRIPLTLAIVPGLIIKSGGERFVVPQLSVVELVRPDDERTDTTMVIVDRIGGTRMLRLREQLLPLVDLAAVLGLAEADDNDRRDGVIVVVQAGGRMFGIGVDDVDDTEEIVVKPVASPLRHLTLFSGNTILGDGAVIMILDPGGLARTVGLESSSRKIVEKAAASKAVSRLPMLLFKAGGGTKAVPLDAVARLELIRRSDIEQASGSSVVQYRGALMPLVALSRCGEDGVQPVLVFNEAGRSVGLMVDEIVDIIEDEVVVELAAALPGIVGTAVLGRHATDVIDQAYWLAQANGLWAGRQPGRGGLPPPPPANMHEHLPWGDVA